ncbi:MAG: hypothetical protein ACI841_002216 [Planctomycetota bacterium]|jgi:hypothetical protein
MGVFETSEESSSRWHQPVRVPTSKDNIFGAAKEMCEDLDGWTVLSIDESAFTIDCECKGGMLAGDSKIQVRIEGPDGIPSSTTHVRSESSGGMMSKDKKYVSEFIKKFTMRVC